MVEIKFYTLDYLLNYTDIGRNWLIRPIFLDEPKITLLAGSPGVGKTFIALEIIVSILFRKSFLDWYQVPNGKENIKLVCFDQENSVTDYAVRFQALIKGNGLEIDKNDEFKVSFVDGAKIFINDFITGDSDVEEIKNSFYYRMVKFIEEEKPTMIILDSLRRFLPGDENDSKSVAEFFEIINKIKNKYNVSFFLIHHTTKNTNDEPDIDHLRGSGDIGASVQSVFKLEKFTDKINFKDYFILTQIKNRDGVAIGSIPFSLETKTDSEENLTEAKFSYEFFYHRDNGVTILTKDICEWIATVNIEKFTLEEVNDNFPPADKRSKEKFKKTIIEALYDLHKKKFLTKEGRHYKVNLDMLSKIVDLLQNEI